MPNGNVDDCTNGAAICSVAESDNPCFFSLGSLAKTSSIYYMGDRADYWNSSLFIIRICYFAPCVFLDEKRCCYRNYPDSFLAILLNCGYRVVYLRIDSIIRYNKICSRNIFRQICQGSFGTMDRVIHRFLKMEYHPSRYVFQKTYAE